MLLGIPAAAEIWFLGGMKILDRLLGSLRGCCQSLPDLRQGGDVRYTMADIGLSAFSLFFIAEPVVSGAPAPSGGGTGALELSDAVRPGQDPQRQPCPDAAGPGQSQPLPPSLRRGGDRTGAFGRPGGFPAAWRPRADRSGRHRVSRVEQGPLSAVLDPQARQRQDR